MAPTAQITIAVAMKAEFHAFHLLAAKNVLCADL
jgi:hypothetical protein